jgi:hypothetical protein
MTVMSAIAAANSSAYSAVASLLSNAASLATTDASTQAASSATPDSPVADPTDSVDISDHAKATLARAKADQVAANTLAAQVAATRNPDAKDPAPQKSSTDITASFDQLTGVPATSAADDTAPSGVTTPEVNFSGGLRAGGFTIAAKGSASTWSSEIDIMGPNGFSFIDKVFGAGVGMGTGEFSGGSSGSGMSTTMQKQGNQEIITVSQASASASTVATGSSVQSAASSQSSSTTFVVDFSTGQISMLQTAAASAATSSTVVR